MASFARPLTSDDLEVLEPVEQAYTESLGLEPVLGLSSLTFYARSGHSFVAMTDKDVTGFVLAHAVWDGTRPAVYVNHLAVADLQDDASREALLEAVTKSAYDAAVYDIRVLHPQPDEAGQTALATKQYTETPITVYERILGSRGQGD